MSDQARPPRMKFPKIEGSPLLSNDEAQALRAVLLGLDPMDTSGNPPSLDIWLAARDFYHSPEAVERAAKAGVEHCREWLDGENGYCGARAEFILWGKLLKPEALGPRCYDHAAKHVGHSALVPGANFALFDLRPLAALDATKEDQ